MIGGAHGRPAGDRVQDAARPLLNGFVNYEFWLPVAEDEFRRRRRLHQEVPGQGAGRRRRSARLLHRRLGLRPARRCWQQAVKATKSLDDDKLADYIRANTFKTVVGDVKFGKDGEWAAVARAAGPVPEHQGQRRRAVQGHGDPGRCVTPAEVQVRQGDLSLREGEVGRTPSERDHPPRGSRCARRFLLVVRASVARTQLAPHAERSQLAAEFRA